MNEREAEDRNYVADYCNDDTAYCDGHCVIWDGREDLSHDDNVHDRETAADYYVEDWAELCTVEAEGVTGGSDCAETKLSKIRFVIQ